MKNFDIKNRVKLYNCNDFQLLEKLSCFSEDDEIIEHLEEVSDEGWFALIEGNVEFEGDLNLNNFFENIISTFSKNPDNYIQLLWITGKLNISKTLHIKENQNYCDDMVVEGDVTTKNIIAGGINLYFLKDLNISGIYYYKSGAEGLLYTKGKENIRIETDNNKIWKINKKRYEFNKGISKKQAQEIFTGTYDFLTFDEDSRLKPRMYYLENEELFIKELLNDNNILN
jgi:hypothetical protein